MKEQVRSLFADLSNEEYARLQEALDDHVDLLKEGVVNVLLDFLRGSKSVGNQQLDEITRLARLPDQDTTMALLASSNLICVGSESIEECLLRVREGFDKGGGLTGNSVADQGIRRIMRFSILSVDRFWERRNQPE